MLGCQVITISFHVGSPKVYKNLEREIAASAAVKVFCFYGDGSVRTRAKDWDGASHFLKRWIKGEQSYLKPSRCNGALPATFRGCVTVIGGYFFNSDKNGDIYRHLDVVFGKIGGIRRD